MCVILHNSIYYAAVEFNESNQLQLFHPLASVSVSVSASVFFFFNNDLTHTFG